MRVGAVSAWGSPLGFGGERTQTVLPTPRKGLTFTGSHQTLAHAFRRLFRGRRVTPSPQGPTLPCSQDLALLVPPKPLSSAAGSPLQYVETALGAALRSAGGIAGSTGQFAKLVEDLASLDAKFLATKDKDYSLDRLLSVLRNYARISEYDASRKLTLQMRAVAGLHAIVATLLESTGPGRDGLALHALQGMNAELDNAIRSLRIDCVERFMSSQAATAHERASARFDAEELVGLEFEQAKVRALLLNAFERAGVAQAMGGLATLRMDAVLAGKVTHMLGHRARHFGALVFSLHRIEAELAASS